MKKIISTILLIIVILVLCGGIGAFGSMVVNRLIFGNQDKDSFALIKCDPGEILKQSDDYTWVCAADLVAEVGNKAASKQQLISLLQCPTDYILQSDEEGRYTCSDSADGEVQNTQGLIVVGSTGSQGGGWQAPLTIGTANGLSLVDQVLSMGTASLTKTGALTAGDYAVFYNKISSVSVQNGIKNTGTSKDPVLEVNAGNGLNISSNVLSAVAGDNSITVDANGVKTRLDLDGGLVVSVDGIGLRLDCTADQLIRWDGYSWKCATDNNTTYSAGQGIQISSNTITNTGVITVTAGSGMTNTGTAQNPVLAADFGITDGTIAEGDSVVILAPSTSSRNVIQPTAADATALTVKGHSSQTADLMQIQNSSGTELVTVDNSGNVGIGDDTPDSELDVEGTIRASDIISKGPIVDVRAYGAVGDGSTDDTAAIAAAITALPASGGIIYFPTGQYVTTGIVFNKSNITFRGNGMWNTMIITNSVTNAMFEVNSGADVSNLIFEDMTINGNELAVVGIPVYGNEIVGPTRISRVRFIGSDSNVSLRSANNVVIEDSLFHDLGTAANGGIAIGYGSHNIMIRNNRFLYLANGIITDTGDTFGDTNEEVTEHVTIQDNYFDLGMYTKLPAATGEGGTVTYTATTLTDTAANFTGISGYATYDIAKVMPLKVNDTTGTGVTIYGNRVEDTGATFVTSNVKKGDIIKVGSTHQAIVNSIESETVVWVEEWLSETDRQLVNPPTTTTYKIYGIYLALAHNITATQLTVNSWQSLDGDSVQPSGANWINQDSEVVAPLTGTIYEYIKQNNYAINAESSARYYKIIGNTVKRTYADQISTFGYRFQITNNYVEYGMDMGITVYGDHNLVANNMIRQSGTSGIVVEGYDNIVQSNMIFNHTWRKVIFNDNTLGGITLMTGGRNYVVDNVIDGSGYYPADKGVVVVGLTSGTATTDNVIRGNIMRNHNLGGVVIVGAYATGTQLFGNTENVTATDGGTAPTTSNGIVAETSGNTTFALSVMSGQTGNLQEWRTVSGDSMAYIAPDGSVLFNNQNNATGSFIVHGSADRALVVDYANTRVGVNTQSTPIAGFQVDSRSAGEYTFFVRDIDNAGRFAVDASGNARMIAKTADGSNPYRSTGSLIFTAQYWNGSTAVNEEFQIVNSRFNNPIADSHALAFYNATHAISPLVIAGGPGGQVAVGYDAPAESSLATLGQFHVRSRAASTPGMTIQGAASQTASLQKWLNSSSTVLAEVDASGNLKVPHLVGNTAEPGISAEAGAGTGALIDVVGTDLSGKIVLVTGTGATGSSVQATVTFTTAYGTAPYVVLTPANGNAAALSGATAVYPSSTTTTFTLTSGPTNLTDSTVYEWNYHVIQ